MKKIWILLLLSLLILLSAAGCAAARFDGSETADESQFTLAFTRLDGTRTHSMRLLPGDIVDVVIEKESGRLDILVASADGEVLYRADDADSMVFSLMIQKEYTYKFTVKGKKAAGAVSFTVIR